MARGNDNDVYSELRMLKAVVDEHGNGGGMSGAFRLKEAYVKDPKRMGQLLDTFPMSSVLKKVGASLEKVACFVGY